jgi:hypothetical protein
MSQYIYILLNPAHKSLLKIGRTSRNPEDRAQELSLATGVPQPFLVAYESLVSDSVLAEQQIHEELSRQGYRTNPSREFFEVPLKVAVSVVDRVCKSLSALDDVLDCEADSADDGGWGFLTLGRDHMTGTDTILRDFDKGRQCIENAVALGNGPAFSELADIYLWGLGVRRNSSEAFRLLQQGGERGHVECYYRLWEIYSGTAFNMYTEETERSSNEANPSNADVAFRWYLDAIANNGAEPEFEKVTAYLDWVLGLSRPGIGLPGRHTNAMLENWTQTARQQIAQLRTARVAGVPIQEATDKLTGRSLSLSTIMKFKELWDSHSRDPGPQLKAILSNCDVMDLEYGFSRLPSERARTWAAMFAIYLAPAAAAPRSSGASQRSGLMSSEGEAAGARTPTWWNQIISKIRPDG